MMSDFVGSVGFTQIAGSVPLAPVTAAVSAAATVSPVGWAAEAERRKGAAATTRARPRAAPSVRRDDAGIVWERVADMMVLLVSAGQAGDVPVRIRTIRRRRPDTSSLLPLQRSFRSGRAFRAPWKVRTRYRAFTGG